MGTDIHAVWQAKKADQWEDIPSTWKQNRHYFLFAWLANVRNGFGSAGIPTHSPVQPISEPRGLPKDFDGKKHKGTFEALDPARQAYHTREESAVQGIWMGNHSFSHLSADEILAAPRPDNAWRTGIVERPWFDAWGGKTPPEAWSGRVNGKGIRVAESPLLVDDDTTHVRIYWKTNESELAYFVDEVKRLKELHGEVRLVFGFDS